MKDYIDFCLVVVRQRFGPLGLEIARALTQRNGQTVPDLAKRTGLDIEAVAQVIAAMLQHDVVRVSAPVPLLKPDKSALAKERKSRARRKPRRRAHDSDDDDLDEDEDEYSADAPGFGDYNDAAFFGDRGSGGPLAAAYKPRRAHLSNPCIVFPRDDAGVPLANAGSKAANVKKFVYYIDVNMIRGMSRFSEYMATASRLWGEEGLAITEEFCVSGKRTVAQILPVVIEKLEKKHVEQERRKLEDEAAEREEREAAAAEANGGDGSSSSSSASAGDDDDVVAVKSERSATAAEGPKMPDLSKMSLEELAALPSGLLTLYLEGTPVDSDTMTRIAQAEDTQAASLAKRVFKTFDIMLNQGYIVQSNGFFDEASMQVQARKSRKRKLDNPGPSSSSELKLEQQGLSAKSSLNDDIMAGFAGASSPAASGGSSVSAGSSSSSSEIPLIINHDRFVMHILSDMAYAYATTRAGHMAGRIVVALLRHQATLAPNTGGRLFFVRDQLYTLVSELKRSELPDDAAEFDLISAVELDAAIQRLSHISLDLMGPSRNSPNEYYLLTERLLQGMRFDAAKSLVRERCGGNAAKVFHLLSDRARLEDKQVSDLALLPKKEAKEVLYSMLQAQFVELQEVPRTTERQPSKAFFVWSLPYTTLPSTMLRVVLQAWVNMQTRMLHETVPVQTLLDKGIAQIPYSDTEHNKVNVWAYKFAKCEVVSRGLAQLIVLFKDFTPC